MPPPEIAGDIPLGVMMLYDSTFGRVAISESMYEGPPDFEEWTKFIAEGKSDPCGPTSEAITIRDGVPALLGNSIERTRWNIRWVEGKVEFNILGPKLTRDQVLTIANSVWSSE